MNANRMTYQELASRIERELGKPRTDRATWNAVQGFWGYRGEVQQGLLDRVALLESRMEREHGWTRD